MLQQHNNTSKNKLFTVLATTSRYTDLYKYDSRQTVETPKEYDFSKHKYNEVRVSSLSDFTRTNAVHACSEDLDRSRILCKQFEILLINAFSLIIVHPRQGDCITSQIRNCILAHNTS